MSMLIRLLFIAVACSFLTASHASRADKGMSATRGTAADTQAAPQNVPSAEAFRVLPSPEKEGPEMTPYLLYQTSMAWHQDQLRQSRWSQVKSESDLLALRAELRRSVLEMIGGLPAERTDLHATITGTVAADGFHVERLIYQSIPGLYVTALVYVPDDGSRMHPAVLVAAGHSPKGKIYYQELCQRLVKRGYLVLSWDPLGQGERSQFWDANANKSRYNLICAEHAVMGNLAYLAGTSLARWEVWDGMRAVDYLVTRPDVDAKRINLTGTSGGGFQAALLGALDERIKVIIPSCYITALPMRIANRVFVDPDSDPEQDLFGFVSKQVDHPGLLLMMYPRAVMVAAATLDFFPVQGTHKSYSEVHTFYQRFGHADRIGFAESYNPHQYSLKNQEAALSFLDRFNAMPVRHGLASVIAFKDNDLHVTKSGQVSLDYPDARPLLYYIARFAADHPQQGRDTMARIYHTEQDPAISSWKVGPYASSGPPAELRWELTGSGSYASAHIDRYLLHHSTYLEMPLLHIYSDEGHPKGEILWLSLEGKVTDKDWPQITRLLGDGYDVYSFDFRGLGETRMNYRARSSDDPDLVQGDSEQAYKSPLSGVLAAYVYNSLLTGRPYFLQLMDDMKIVELFINHSKVQAHLPKQPITLAATGEAYYLAARFQQIERGLTILPKSQTPMPDWSTLVENCEEIWPIAFLMPGGALLSDRIATKTPDPEARPIARNSLRNDGAPRFR